MILILAPLSCTSAARICPGSIVLVCEDLISHWQDDGNATTWVCVLYGGGCSDDVNAGDECVEPGRLLMCPVGLLQDDGS